MAKDSAGPGVMNDRIDPDRMPADGELRHEKASVPALAGTASGRGSDPGPASFVRRCV